MDKKEFWDGYIKRRMPIKQLATGAILLFSTLLNILVDYVNVSFDPTIYKDPAYWINLVTTNASVIVILFSVRGYMRERELTTNKEILATQAEIDNTHIVLSQLNLSTRFEEYVNQINEERKLKAYKDRLQLRMSKCKNKKKKKALLERFDNAEKDISFLKVKYNKIRISTIFSKTILKNNEDDNLDDGEEKEVGRLLVNKVLCILAFGVLGSSMAFGVKTFATAFLITTCIKLFQTAYAVLVGGTDGQNFARGTMLSKMKLRLDFVQKFLEKQKT